MYEPVRFDLASMALLWPAIAAGSVSDMAALAASRANPEMKLFRAQLLANGKAPKQAAIAVARKLITLANQLVRENRTWVPKPIPA